MKHSIVLVIVAMFMNPAQAADKQAAEKALTSARELLEKSVAMHGGWKSTADLISSAELSASKGKFDEAADLASQAMSEARLSLEQAQRENKGWSEPDYLNK